MHVEVVLADVLGVELAEVDEPAQGHVGVRRALLLPEDELAVDEERDVVLEPHVQHALDRGELELVRVLVRRAGERVVQRQRVGLLALVAEEPAEERVLVGAGGGCHGGPPLRSCKRGEQRVAVFGHVVEKPVHIPVCLVKDKACTEKSLAGIERSDFALRDKAL